MYIITFYTPSGKTSPIRKFLDSTKVPLRRKILRQFMYVQEFGFSPSIPCSLYLLIEKIAKIPINNPTSKAAITPSTAIKFICARFYIKLFPCRK